MKADRASGLGKQFVILRSLSMIPKILLLVEQIRPRAPQIDDLRTAIPVLLQPRAFEAVECITDPFPTAHHALVLVVAKGAFVANSDESCWADVAVADGAFAVTFVAEAADCDAWLLAAHDEIAMDVMLVRVTRSGALDRFNLRVMARHVVYLTVQVRVRKKGRSRRWQDVRKIYGTREACELRLENL